MISDPNPLWPTEYPYAALQAAGITPDSTQAEVEKASFTLLRRRLMNPVTQAAWNELRDLKRRMLADMLLYDLDVVAELERTRETLANELADDPAPPEAALPPEVYRNLLESIGSALPPVEMAPAPEPDALIGPVTFPSASVIDDLIHFDQ